MDEQKALEQLERASQATTRAVTVPLCQFVFQSEDYCYREPVELTDEPIQPLAVSIATEGLQTPVEFFRDSQGRPVLFKGHRRITAMRLNAQKGVPGFTQEMLVPAIEVVGGTEQDHVVRSIVDNINRKDLTQKERLRAVRTLYHKHVPVERLAPAFGVSVKTLQRAVLLVQHDWMYDLVLKDCIPVSTAVRLLEVAIKANRLAELEADMKEWVEQTKVKIEEKERLRKARDGKGLRPNELLVQTYATKPLVEQWQSQLRKGERFSSTVEWGFGAGVDPDTNKLQIDSLKVDLAKEPLPHLATVAAKLSKVSKDVLSYLKTRHALEAAQGPQDAIRDESDQPLDLDLLRSEGLGDLADDLEFRLLEEEERAKGSGFDEEPPETPAGS